MGPLISGKSRLVKYYNLTRLVKTERDCLMKILLGVDIIIGITHFLEGLLNSSEDIRIIWAKIHKKFPRVECHKKPLRMWPHSEMPPRGQEVFTLGISRVTGSSRWVEVWWTLKRHLGLGELKMIWCGWKQHFSPISHTFSWLFVSAHS